MLSDERLVSCAPSQIYKDGATPAELLPDLADAQVSTEAGITWLSEVYPACFYRWPRADDMLLDDTAARQLRPAPVRRAARVAFGLRQAPTQASVGSTGWLMTDHVAYIGTKAAAEFGARGIRVDGIAPSLTRRRATRQEEQPNLPLRRLGTAQNVTDAAIWLAASECFVTGAILQIDGGMALHGASA